MHHDTKRKPKKKTFKQRLSILCVTEEKKNMIKLYQIY
jgi:hypothetical protein